MRLKRMFIINMAILAGMLALSIWTWGQLPADSRIPVRFDQIAVLVFLLDVIEARAFVRKEISIEIY